MFDERYKKFADILLNHSLSIKKDDLFIMNGSPQSMPLLSAVYQGAVKKGAHPTVRMGMEHFSELFYKHATKEQLEFVSPLHRFELEKVDARLSILSPENTRYMTHADPKKQSIRSKSQQPIHEIFLKRAAEKKLRWCVTQFPTNAAAQDAEMSLSEYESFVFDAAHVQEEDPVGYWETVGKRQQRFIEMLSSKDRIHIVAEDTDLTLSVKDRKWINCYGKENFPDGEVFTGPVEDSAEGYIHFSFPSVYGGRQVDDVKLWFEKGNVVKKEALSGLSFLNSMLDTDDGAKRLGEFAFGLNDGVKQFTKNTLFDEKIGGTIHLAVGSGYPETKSTNVSGIHWDMVCDLRKKGEIYADDELIYRQGKFII